MYQSKFETGKIYNGKYHVTKVSIREEDDVKRVWYLCDGKHSVVSEDEFEKLIGKNPEVVPVPEVIDKGAEARYKSLVKRYVDTSVKKEETEKIEKKVIKEYESKKNAGKK